MPKVGDGTGQGGAAVEKQGTRAVEDARPNPVRKPYGSGEGGTGPELSKTGNRTSPIRRGK